MGCAPCGAKAALVQTLNRSRSSKKNTSVESSEPCDYTFEMLQNFREKLIWFKEKGFIIKYKIETKRFNKALGMTISSLNMNNRCTYKNELDKVSDLVDFIVSIQENA